MSGGSADGGRAARRVRRVEAHDGGDGPARPHAGPFGWFVVRNVGGAHRGVGDGRCRPGAGKAPRPSRRAVRKAVGWRSPNRHARAAEPRAARCATARRKCACRWRSESATQVERAGDAARGRDGRGEGRGSGARADPRAGPDRSPDAVQALIKWAQPTGRFFGRKPSELRVAAVEACGSRPLQRPGTLEACRTTVTAPSARRPAGP